MKQVIVTGATGFIGSAFVKYMLDRGVQVLALGRKKKSEIPPSRRTMLEGSTYINLEMSRIQDLRSEMNEAGFDVQSGCVFFNLAWGGRAGLSDLDCDAQLKNISNTESAISVAALLNVDRFVHVGTMEEAFTERYLELDYNTNNEYNRHVIYSVAKLAAKTMLKVRASQLGIPLIYILHSHVMGPGDEKDSFLQVALKKIIRGEQVICSSGDQYFDVIALEDCLSGYSLICENGRSGENYWVGSGQPCQLRDYILRMHSLFPRAQLPLFGGLTYNDIILDRSVFSITKLVEHTGYKPFFSYEETVLALYETLRKSPES